MIITFIHTTTAKCLPRSIDFEMDLQQVPCNKSYITTSYIRFISYITSDENFIIKLTIAKRSFSRIERKQPH